MSNLQDLNSQLPSSGGKCDTPRSVERYLEITVISSTVKQHPESLPNPQTLHVAVAFGNVIQMVDATTAEESTTWNKTVRFVLEAGKADDIAKFTISLYLKKGEESNLLGQTTEDPSQYDKDAEITKVFSDTQSSIKFRVGSTRPSIFALIIGVDQYSCEDIPDLIGAVNDAKDMEDLLINDFNVPRSNVFVLHNKDATRQNILDSIQTHLLRNTCIEQGDAMIIFFAGHGNRVAAPEGWFSSDGEIETICPHDESMKDRDDEPIPGIPDRTINDLTRRLAETKGNNITLIFDSCHCGGIARTGDIEDDHPDDLKYTPRSFPNPCPINNTVDSTIWGRNFEPRGAFIKLPAGFRHEDMASHVLLAACKPTQTAHETLAGNLTRGYFSSQLIPKLRELCRRSVDISYLQLMNQVPSYRQQTPQCHGRNKECLLFTLGVPTKSKHYCRLKPSIPAKPNDAFLEVDFGTMHGVVRGTEFLVVHGPTREHIGKLIAKKVCAKRSLLIYPSDTPEFHIPEDAEARIWNWNSKAFTLDVSTDAEDVKNHILSLHIEHFLRIIDKNLDPHIFISVDEDRKYKIERLPGFFLDTDIKGGKEGLTDTPSVALSAIGHFRYHLQRSQITNSSLSADTLIEMKLFQLKSLAIVANNLTVKNLFDTKYHANLQADDAEEYGLCIQNKSQSDLFVYIFYFDPADYSIQAWYLPPSHNVDPPLACNACMSLGYGANGGDPFSFCLDAGENAGTGFIKVFVSTKYVDMSSLAQLSPFGSSSQVPRDSMTLEAESSGKTLKWASLIAKITVEDLSETAR
ncbi:hypothetical protein HYPSUDRAFT_35516 [Hypholoma sublateritium FD-334 SS-4]|uniref:Peptidase C14 caspase domain-containing protein n=1 Tax=Hypholoma sublateritium (strain FD-334 SS-4) TaxID=945553 RepID=A0A0D2P7P9_HYPSF|nr:hypothetical protein HYPSUDRAFT_35516 [Hypholoma sublateritium FD-334 SS-4]